MNQKLFDMLWFLAALCIAVVLGRVLARDPIVTIAIIVPLFGIAMLLHVTGSLLHVFIIACGAYFGSMGLFNSFQTHIRGVQLNDVVTLGIVAMSCMFLLSLGHKARRSWTSADLFYFLFMIWTVLRAINAPDRLDALKDTVFYFMFWIVMATTRLHASGAPKNRQQVLSALLVGFGVCMAFLAFFAGMGMVAATKIGLNTPMGKRPLALYLLTILSITIATWLYPDTRRQKRTAFAFSLLAAGVILATLSRTVILIVGLVHVPFTLIVTRTRSLLSPVNVIKLAGYALFLLLLMQLSLKLDVVQERLFYSTNRTHIVDLMEWENLNTMGRRNVWPVIFRRAMERPWMGHGTGSARAVSRALCNWDHPHCDYLRLFHDQGAIGLFLFGAFWTACLRRLTKGTPRDNVSKRTTAAAFCASLGILISFVTDNTIVYTFVMMPLAMLVGTSLAGPERADTGEEKTNDTHE